MGENKIMEFRKELTDLINKYNIENGSNTPDYVLAEFIDNMLMAFDIAVNNREKTYGRNGVKDKYSVGFDEGYGDE
jgi:hypothetical protein